MAMLAILAACHKYFACGNKVLFCSAPGQHNSRHPYLSPRKIFPTTAGRDINPHLMKKKRSEATQTLRGGCIAPPQTPFLGRRTAKI